MPVGAVYVGNNVIYKSEVVSLRTRTGEPMVRSRSNFDNDGAVLVPYLQVVYPVFDLGILECIFIPCSPLLCRSRSIYSFLL